MRRISSGRTFASLLSLALLAVVALPGSALALPVEPGGPVEAFPTYGGTPVACADNTSYAVRGFTSKEDYEIRGGGIVTGWQYLAASGSGSVALEIVSGDNYDSVFTPITESAIETPEPSKLNDFKTHIALAPGDYWLAIRSVSGGPECYSTGFPYNAIVQASPSPTPGSGATVYGNSVDGALLNVAVFEESDNDHDGFGDDTEDGCPRDGQRHDDCVKPDIPRFTSSFPRHGKITFTFSGFEPGTFECHLQDKKFAPCTSPVKLKHLKPGHYNFTVRSVDANGNIGPQTSSTFRIGPPPPPHH